MTPIPTAHSGKTGDMETVMVGTQLSPFLSTGTEKIIHANINQKQAEAVILISDEENFRRKELSQDEERYCVITENSTHKEDITTTNTYSSHNIASKYIKQKFRLGM